MAAGNNGKGSLFPKAETRALRGDKGKKLGRASADDSGEGLIHI